MMKGTSEVGLSDAPKRSSFNYGWVNVALAALLMLATLPGRTQGLGLITEPLLKDLQIDRIHYANINLWATLIGAIFCFPAGYLIDRFGLRPVSVLLVLLLSCTVWQMSRFAGTAGGLFILVLLTRALGQSALSVVSITAVGKSFGKRAGFAMGIYSFLLSVLFVIAFIVVGHYVSSQGWRVAWLQIAGFLALVVVPMVFLFLRPIAQPGASIADSSAEMLPVGTARESFSLVQALQTPAFWIFGMATALFGLVSSGLGLFNEAVLAERGFDQKTFHTFLAVTTFVALLGQLACGWLALRRPLQQLMGIALLIYAVALGMLPFIKAFTHLWVFAALIGSAGGFITVIFFAIWGNAFGRAHLGRIQGAAQLLTVFASAVGPLLFAKCAAATGSYTPLLLSLSIIVFGMAIAAWKVTMPKLVEAEESYIPATSSTPQA